MGRRTCEADNYCELAERFPTLPQEPKPYLPYSSQDVIGAYDKQHESGSHRIAWIYQFRLSHDNT